MDFQTIATYMYPYWILGVLVIMAVIAAGQKHLVRVEARPVFNWCVFLIVMTAIRLFLLNCFGFQGITGPPIGLKMIPWTAALTVFWEDACHGLPLLILSNMIGDKKRWAKAVNALALVLVSISFGIGHLYQGPFVALLLCFYVSSSINYGKKYGFGTVMLCHTLFDLVTFLYVKYFV